MTTFPGMTTFCRVVAGGFRWAIEPSSQHLLLGPNGLRLDEWLSGGQARLLKSGPHRRVYRVALQDLTVYVKHNLLPDWRTWLRNLVRPSKARMELDRIQVLIRHDIPTVAPLALGEEQSFLGPGENFLITRALENVQQLNAFLARCLPMLPRERQRHVRRALARALGRLTGRLHQAGLRHDDLHPANILVRLDECGEPELFLIDVSALRVGAALDWPASRDNLVILNRWFLPRASRADRLRAWCAYIETRAAASPSEPAAWPADPTPFEDSGRATRATQCSNRIAATRVKELERQTARSIHEFCKERDGRCLRPGKYFRRLRGPGVAGMCVSELDADLANSLRRDPDEPFRRPGVRLFKDSRSSTVAELEIIVAGQPRRMIYKRFCVTAWTDRWVSLLRRSAALRSWVWGHAFADRCLPTPRPLLVLHRRRRGLLGEGYLLTEKIDDAFDLHRFADSLSDMSPADARHLLRRRIDDVARLVRRLHEQRFSNRDLKASNILLSRDPQAPTAPFRPVDEANPLLPSGLPVPATAVWLIDLVGVQPHDRLPRRRRVQNLGRLNASFVRCAALTCSDRLRFLRFYLQWGLRGRQGWKKWWHAVAAATQAKVARNLRAGRPLG